MYLQGQVVVDDGMEGGAAARAAERLAEVFAEAYSEFQVIAIMIECPPLAFARSLALPIARSRSLPACVGWLWKLTASASAHAKSCVCGAQVHATSPPLLKPLELPAILLLLRPRTHPARPVGCSGAGSCDAARKPTSQPPAARTQNRGTDSIIS